MITLIISIAVLLLGYFFYSRFIEEIEGADQNRQTPAYRLKDGILALLGVVAAPITSGDTAFRSARQIVADFLKYKQGPVKNRLFISIPLFLVGFLLTRIDFGISAAVTALAGFLFLSIRLPACLTRRKMTGSTGKIKSL